MDVQRLAKVLALAASDNDSEALHALRTARRLLEAAGQDFVALAGRLGGTTGERAAEVEALENEVFDLRNDLRHLRAECDRLQGGEAPFGGLAGAAQDAAQIIRLKSEINRLADLLDEERATAAASRANEADIGRQLMEAMAEAGRLAARLENSESRRQRLEVEVKRLGTLKGALQSQLAETQTAAEMLAAELQAVQLRDDLAGKPARTRRAKAAGQFSLL
ncbi:MAG: metalloendopeptidase [Magnetospirillum sp.]|nr:metalloendopeptidase [Magnetospirillum sp.]